MKKILVVVLSVIMLLFLVACDNEQKIEKNCLYCGEAISKSVSFCEHCGVDAKNNGGDKGSTTDATPTVEPTEETTPTPATSTAKPTPVLDTISDKEISEFEEMIKKTSLVWYISEGFESDKIDGTYFVTNYGLMLKELYSYYYGENNEPAFPDPQKQFDAGAEVFEIEKVKHMLKNMFNISFGENPNGGDFYTTSDKLYIRSSDLGWATYLDSAKIIGIKKLENNKYALKFSAIWKYDYEDTISDNETYVFIAHQSMENNEKSWVIDKFTKDATYFDEITGTRVPLTDGTKTLYTTKEIENMVADYFNKTMYSDENPGVYVVFSNETKVINNMCSMTVRFQGTYATTANYFVADVTVNIATGEMCIQGADSTKMFLY